MQSIVQTGVKDNYLVYAREQSPASELIPIGTCKVYRGTRRA